MRVRFGDCLLDTDTRELFRRDQPVHLPPKAFRLLELLVENRPRAVAKAEIHDKIWPGTYVSEATLASAISDIRAAIGQGGRDPHFIRTVHGYGYAFSGQASEAKPSEIRRTPANEWRLFWGDREVALSEGENLLGRDHEATVWIDSKGVSRHHAQIVIHGQAATLEDLGSKNGTYLQGRRINSRQPLSNVNQIRIGPASVVVRLYSAADSTETQKQR